MVAMQTRVLNVRSVWLHHPAMVVTLVATRKTFRRSRKSSCRSRRATRWQLQEPSKFSKADGTAEEETWLVIFIVDIGKSDERRLAVISRTLDPDSDPDPDPVVRTGHGHDRPWSEPRPARDRRLLHVLVPDSPCPGREDPENANESIILK